MNKDKIKVLLIFSPFKDKTSFGDPGMIAPIGLVYVATYLQEKLGEQIEVKILDGAILGYEESLKQVKEFNPDIFGISFYTSTAVDAYSFINDVKAFKPEILAVAGGPHVTAMYDEALTKSKLDVVIIGEGEETFYALVNNYFNFNKETFKLKLNEVKRIAYVNAENRVTKTETAPYLEALDNLPFPNWELLPLQNYSGWYLKKNTKEAPLIFSRGCPFNCIFCSNAVWKICNPYLRVRSPKNVVDEIEQLVEKYGINEIYDCSDEFNNNINNAIEICKEIIRRGLHKKIAWKTQLRAFPFPEELIKVMAESGCWYVNLGIESGNQETLDGIKKMITLDQVKNALRILKKYKIKVQGLFMLYNVWEDAQGNLQFEDTAKTKKTLDFARELIREGLLDFIGWSVTTPYPGSQLYDIALRHNLIRPELIGNWSMWVKSSRYVMDLPGVTMKEQVRLRNEGSWLRFVCIIKSGNYTFRDLVLLFRKGLSVAKMNFKEFIKLFKEGRKK